MSEELIVIESLNVEKLFNGGSDMDRLLKDIEGKVDFIGLDAETAKGRAEIKSLAYKVAQTKTALEKAGKSLADSYNEKLKPINSERKKAKEFLTQLQDKIRKPVTEYEQKEKERISEVMILISKLFPVCIEGKTSEELIGLLSIVERTPIDDSFQELKPEALEQKLKSIDYLNSIIPDLKKQEDDQAELEELRKQKAIQEKKDYELKVKQEAEKNAQLEIQRKQQAEEAEKVARQADEEHRKKINNESLNDLQMLGLTKEQGMTIIKAIALNQISHIQINY